MHIEWIVILSRRHSQHQPLSALSAIFGVEDVAKGDFAHLFNQLKFQYYYGPIPALEWYNSDTKTTKKTQ